MRVTGGAARGVILLAPRGLETRPTSDRVREAIFSILHSMGAEFGRVLDLYAGTGALAIEALSRGAAFADLVERAAPACAVIRRNLARARVADRARLHCMDVRRALAQLGEERFSIVFLDPPYADPTTPAVLDALGRSDLLADGAVVVLEHAWGRPVPEAVGPLALDSDRRYGDTGVAFYR